MYRFESWFHHLRADKLNFSSPEVQAIWRYFPLTVRKLCPRRIFWINPVVLVRIEFLINLQIMNVVQIRLFRQFGFNVCKPVSCRIYSHFTVKARFLVFFVRKLNKYSFPCVCFGAVSQIISVISFSDAGERTYVVFAQNRNGIVVKIQISSIPFQQSGNGFLSRFWCVECVPADLFFFVICLVVNRFFRYTADKRRWIRRRWCRFWNVQKSGCFPIVNHFYSGIRHSAHCFSGLFWHCFFYGFHAHFSSDHWPDWLRVFLKFSQHIFFFFDSISSPTFSGFHFNFLFYIANKWEYKHRLIALVSNQEITLFVGLVCILEPLKKTLTDSNGVRSYDNLAYHCCFLCWKT